MAKKIKIDSNDKVVPIGKKSKSIKKIILVIVASIIIIGLVISLIIMMLQNNELKKQVKKLEKKKQTITVKNTNEEYLYFWAVNHNKVDFMDENIVFVIEGYGNYYYTYDCMMKKVGDNEFYYHAYNKEAAISMGYIGGGC